MFPINIASYPQKDKSLFGGNIFILQGTRTYSGGDIFCCIMAENKLGVRFGQETSQYGKTWLPAQPDMYWDVDNTYEFSEKELNSMIIRYQNSIR
jgi:hypothetical protein